MHWKSNWFPPNKEPVKMNLVFLLLHRRSFWVRGNNRNLCLLSMFDKPVFLIIKRRIREVTWNRKKKKTKTDWIESTDILTIQICSLGNPGCTIDIPGYLHITLGKGEKKIINFMTDKENNKPWLDAFMNRTGPINVKGTT